MRIAIASSGLGHVARGIETWALDTAVALSQTMNQEGDKIFEQKETKERKGGGLGSAEGGEEKSSLLSSFPSVQTSSTRDSVTLFCAAPLANPVPCHVVALGCLKRGDRYAKFLARIFPGFTWRWGFKDTYGWEQFTFWMLLWPKLRRGKFDILHVQDPMVANWCRLFRRWGLVKTKEILAHGTEESVEFLHRFDYLQELTPHYAARHNKTRPGQLIGVAPNFVDTALFVPKGDRKEDYRRKLGIPCDAFVVVSVGSINRSRKRMDYLVSEFVRWERKGAVLVIAGACDNEESKALMAEAKASLGERLIVLQDQSRYRMPDIYAVADIFVLCALKELFGIAFLEAMACGIPCIGHQYPVTEWVLGVGEKNSEQKSQRAQSEENCISAGGGKNHSSFASFATSVQTSSAGGKSIDMRQEGALAAALAGLTSEWLALHGRQARERAVAMFSADAVIGQYVNYYRQVLEPKV